MLEVPIVNSLIRELVVPLPMLLPVQELPPVKRPVLPLLLTLTSRQITQPFPTVRVILSLVHKCPPSLCYVVPNLSLVVASPGENKPALTVRKPI